MPPFATVFGNEWMKIYPANLYLSHSKVPPNPVLRAWAAISYIFAERGRGASIVEWNRRPWLPFPSTVAAETWHARPSWGRASAPGAVLVAVHPLGRSGNHPQNTKTGHRSAG